LHHSTTASTPNVLIRNLPGRGDRSVNDAIYVALAEALECVFVTRDRRLSLTPGIRCPVVVVS
jgi:predicted nucleic acid-binding protein